MAAAAYTSDLTDIYAGAGSITNWTALGGGASGLNAETDYFIQGTGCTSKNAFASSTRGMIYNNGSGVTIPTDGAVLLWQTHQTANSLDLQANGGWQTLIGSSTTAYKHYYVAGSDTIVYDDRWRCIAINPSITPSTTTGSPTATVQTFGILNTMVGGPTKGSPQANDAIRYGRVQYDYTNGDLANGYATFAGAAAFNDNSTRRYGQIQLSKGAYFIQGLHNLGTSGTAVDFRDSNKTINIINTEFVTSAFNTIAVNNASSNVEWSGIIIQSLGTVSRGTFVVNNNATVTLDSCTFADMNTFSFDTNSTVSGTAFNRCNSVTLGGGTFNACTFSRSTAASSVIATDLSDLNECTFISDGSNHAVELTSVGTGSMDWNCFATGYVTGSSGNNVTTSSTGNETIYLNFSSSATFTINVASGATIPSIRKGASMTGQVNIVAGAVSVTITAVETDGTPVTNARVFVETNTGSGNLPYQASVSITRSGSTATVTHSSHGLQTGDKVVIRGANQNEYVGIKTITVTGTNTYTFTVSGTPATPATGTIVSSFVFISDVTDSNGQVVSPSRTLTANQSIKGNVRKSSASPFYKTGQVVGTINTATGLSATVVMIRDE